MPKSCNHKNGQKSLQSHDNASIVTIQPSKLNNFNSFGIAVISFDLSLTLYCPRDTPLAAANALTKYWGWIVNILDMFLGDNHN